MVINVDKTLTCNISLATNRSYETPCVPITIGSKIVNRVNEFKLFGIWFTCNCKWNKHIDDIRTRANDRLILLSRLKRSGLSTAELLKYYKGCIRPIMEYACPVWHTMLTDKLNSQLELIQTRALRIVLGQYDIDALMAQYNIPSLASRRETLCIKFFRRWCSDNNSTLPLSDYNLHDLRQTRKFKLLCARTSTFANSLLPYGLRNWQQHLYNLLFIYIFILYQCCVSLFFFLYKYFCDHL